jgi:hypothetical protein
MHAFAGLIKRLDCGAAFGDHSRWPDAFRKSSRTENGMLTIPGAPDFGPILNREALRKSEVAE